MHTAQVSGAVRTRVWRDGVVVREGADLDEVSTLLADPANLVWADLSGADHGQLEALADELGFAATAVEDALASAERPKATRHPGHLLFITYATRLEPVGDEPTRSRLGLTKITAFLLPRALVTVRSDDEFDLAEVIRRWDDDIDLLRLGPSALLHGLLDTVVDGHFDTVQALDDMVEDLQDGLFDANNDARLAQQRIFRVRKELVQLRRVVLPMREVVGVILRHRAEGAAGQERLDDWFADLYDHVLRVSEWTESLRDMVSTIVETNLSLADARLNTIMKKLTSWAAIIAVPTAVTGWFGQNVPYLGYGARFGVWLSTGVIVGSALILYWQFRRRDWL